MIDRHILEAMSQKKDRITHLKDKSVSLCYKLDRRFECRRTQVQSQQISLELKYNVPRNSWVLGYWQSRLETSSTMLWMESRFRVGVSISLKQHFVVTIHWSRQQIQRTHYQWKKIKTSKDETFSMKYNI